jgi:glycosyltransferase involved in cell wall biosynthesis
VTPGDPREIADAIVALEKDPARREAMGQRARSAASQFDRRRQVAAHAAVLQEVAAAR